MQLPKIHNYMSDRYSSDNYGKHSIMVELGELDIYYSYDTPVAFRYDGKLTVRVNDWSTTTGKHLNRIDGGSKEAKKERLESDLFEEKLGELLKKLNLTI